MRSGLNLVSYQGGFIPEKNLPGKGSVPALWQHPDADRESMLQALDQFQATFPHFIRK
jgi:hypothetical protein